MTGSEPVLPDPAGAHAVLVGVAGYRRMPPVPAAANNVTSVTVAGEDLVASGDENGTLCLWRLADGTPIASRTADDLGVAPAPEFGAAGPNIFALAGADLHGAPTLVIGRADGSLTILDAATSRVRHTIDAHTGPVSGLAICPVAGRHQLPRRALRPRPRQRWPLGRGRG